MTLQEYIPGTNVRSYVMGDVVYSAEIRSPSVDFREDMQAELIPVKLPDSVRLQCSAIAQGFMMEWAAIDWRLKPTGDYLFLKANPNTMFLYFKNQGGYPIAKQILEIVMK